MTYEAKLLSGILLITIPTIQFGGYFLLTILSGGFAKANFTDFQKTMFRAGHAHAGVLVILSLIAELLTDHATLGTAAMWYVRGGFPTAALLISGGFFFAAMHKGATKPNAWIKLIYAGIFVLGAALVILGIGLIR